MPLGGIRQVHHGFSPGPTSTQDLSLAVEALGPSWRLGVSFKRRHHEQQKKSMGQKSSMFLLRALVTRIAGKYSVPTFPTQSITFHSHSHPFLSGLNYCRYLLIGKTQMIVVYRSASKQDGGTAHQIVLVVLVARANTNKHNRGYSIDNCAFSRVTYSAHLTRKNKAMQFAFLRCD